MSNPFIVAFLAAIAFGILLLNPWVLIFYLFFLAFATAVALIIVVFSLVKRTRNWKTALLCLAVLYTAALSSYTIQSYLRSGIVKKRKHFVAALYDYRNKYGHFPKNAREVAGDIFSFRGNYIPDTSLENFELFTRDFYGFPISFVSKDSSWKH